MNKIEQGKHTADVECVEAVESLSVSRRMVNPGDSAALEGLAESDFLISRRRIPVIFWAGTGRCWRKQVVRP